MKLQVILGYFLMACCGALSSFGADNRSIDFNSGWKFALVNDSAAISPDYDDSCWRTLNLPHDWAIEGTFDVNNPSGAGGGALPGGIGWYRKTFEIEPKPDEKVFIDFDGAYMNSTVWVNGHELGTRPYGYASFSYDITPYLYPGKNAVAVRVDNGEQPNSRWYSGCGIYRNVWLRRVGLAHIPQDGIFVRTDGNRLLVDTEISSPDRKKLKLTTEVIAPDNQIVASASKSLSGGATVCNQSITVKSPLLWSAETPNLYTVVSKLSDAKSGKVIDVCTTRTGFRSFEFDAHKGFSLNGNHMKINGVCLHHDAGALGAEVNRRAIERQLEILKEMGANAIRCTHNPPAPELLDLCDEMGFLVMDETFDMWRKRKTANDYARYFDEWHERDLDGQVRRDRNHPSIIMWSIGNEVLEQWSDAGADTLSLAEANLILNFGHSADNLAADGEMSVNSLLTRKLADRVRQLDPTRPITAGCNEPDPGNHLFRSGALDIIGYNYHDDWFKNVPVTFPGKPFIVTESVSGLMTRGYYQMPSDSMYVWPVRWDIPFHQDNYSCSSYDNCHVPWGNTHEGTMRLVEENDFISGQFVWTGFDYIGEPTPYGFPARSSYFGIVDLAGIPKDIYYMYQSQWRPDKTVLHVFPHWNWQEGQNVDIWAYYNNADEVELLLNGESLGSKSKPEGEYHVMWRVPFEPGTLTAISRKDGVEVARKEVSTAGDTYQIRLTPDRTTIEADGSDLSYVTVEILDRDGNLCPWATNTVTFDVTGAGLNAGVDNGSPISMERFKGDTRNAFYGKAMLIVRSDGTAGDIHIKATSPGLRPALTTLAAHK